MDFEINIWKIISLTSLYFYAVVPFSRLSKSMSVLCVSSTWLLSRDGSLLFQNRRETLKGVLTRAGGAG